MKLKGKVALITGGGTGIGAAVADRFVAEGAKVCITGRRQELLDKAVAAYPPGSAVACPGNVSRDEDAERMTAAALKFGERIDILVNNAGITRDTLIMRMTEEDWDAVIDINLKGAFNCSKAIIQKP